MKRMREENEDEDLCSCCCLSAWIPLYVYWSLVSILSLRKILAFIHSILIYSLKEDPFSLTGEEVSILFRLSDQEEGQEEHEINEIEQNRKHHPNPLIRKQGNNWCRHNKNNCISFSKAFNHSIIQRRERKSFSLEYNLELMMIQ